MLPREYVIYESIASWGLDDGKCITMPLGVYRVGSRLYARLYPGSRVYENSDRLRCAVIALPSDPLDYARILFHEAALDDLGYCCPTVSEPYIVIEAHVKNVEGEDSGTLLVTLEPLDVRIYKSPEPFTRLASCLVELLIAYTRIRYWRGCADKMREYESIARCIDFMERRAVGEYRRYYRLVASEIRRLVEPCLKHAPE